MLNRKLHPDEWQDFFDNLTEEFQQDRNQRHVKIRVFTPEWAGARDLASWLEFEQLSYDPATYTLHVLLDGFDYQIDEPNIIWAAVKADGSVERLTVIRRDGSKDYIEFSTYRHPHYSATHGPRTGDHGRSRSSGSQGARATERFWSQLRGPLAG